MIKAIKSNRWLIIALLLSFLFFIKKGVQYALVGSYLPLIFVALFLSLILIGTKYKRKIVLIILKLWSIWLIIWSSLRILISIVNYFTNTFDEYHLNTQLGINSIGISLIMLLFGLIIIRHSKDHRLKTLL